MDISTRYKQRRRKTFAHRLIFSAFICFCLIIAIWGFFWISFFRIKTITVIGILDSDNVSNMVTENIKGINKYFLPMNNYFIINTDDIVKLIKAKNFGVAAVRVKFPHTLSILFPEREARFIICNQNNTCFYINEDGLLYSEVPQYSDYPLPLIVIAQNASSTEQSEHSLVLGDQLTGTSTMRFLNIITRGLSHLGIKSKTIQIALHSGVQAPFDIKEIKIFTPKEWYIYFDTQMSPEETLNSIRLLFEQKIKENKTKLQYIDMRFENKAFYMVY